MAKRNFGAAVAAINPNAEEDGEADIQIKGSKPGKSPVKKADPKNEYSVDKLEELSAEERIVLQQQESIIEEGLATFIRVGTALTVIRDNKLYRSTHLIWDDYAAQKWNLVGKRSYQLMASAKLVTGMMADNQRLIDTQKEGTVVAEIVKNKKQAPYVRESQTEDVAFTEQRHDGQAGEPTTDPQQSTQEGEQNGGGGEPDDDQLTGTTAGSEQALAGQDSLSPESDESGQGEQTSEQIDALEAEEPLTEFPSKESHAAALLPVPEPQRAEVWGAVVKESKESGLPITAEKIKKKAADKGGVPRNDKPKKDRPTAKKGFGKSTDDDDDDMGGLTSDLTRKAMKSTWIAPEEKEVDSDVPGDSGQLLDEDESVEPGSREAKIIEMGKKIAHSTTSFGEVMITFKGSWLINADLVELWKELRGEDREIDQDYKDTLTMEEANDFKLLAILARM